jgi:sugar transferase (PEP-CTERM/EpsH1 system associated)
MATSRGQEIRILHVIETLEMGGAETVVANLVNNMSPGFHPGVCCLVSTGSIAKRIRPDVEIIELGKTGEGNDYRIPFRLAKILESRRIDIVQSHDWGTLLETVGAAALARTAAVHMAHGPTIHYPAGDGWAPMKRWVRRRTERLASLKLKRAIAVSEVVRRELVEHIGIPAKKVVLVHNGIDLTSKPLENLEEKRQRLGWGAGDVLLITVGRLAPIKNYSVLLQALAMAAVGTPKLRLVMVGDGSERSKLEAEAGQLGLASRVIFLGERSDVKDWLAIAHIFVLPSIYEGISIALLEAMAAGLPAVVSRVGGNPEVVVEGQTGLLVESGDAAGLAFAMVELAGDEMRRRRMGVAARSRVEDEFDLAKTVQRYEEIYLQALGALRA